MARDAVDATLGAAEARRRPSATAELPILGAAARSELDALGGPARRRVRPLRGRRDLARRPPRDRGRRRCRSARADVAPARRRLPVPRGRGRLGRRARARRCPRRRPRPPDPRRARSCATGAPRSPHAWPRSSAPILGWDETPPGRRGHGLPRRRPPPVRRAGMTSPSTPVVLALDQGTTSSRAIAFDRRAPRSRAPSGSSRRASRRPGHVTHDPEDIWASQLTVAREVVDAVGGPENVVAIGITNQRETTVVWERATGRPVAPAIVWQSRITAPFCDRLRADGHEPIVRERTGLPLDAYFSGPKIRHILEEGGLRSRAERGELALRDRGQLAGRLALTGGRRPRDRRLERLAHAPVRHPHARLGRRPAAADGGAARRCCPRSGRRRRSGRRPIRDSSARPIPIAGVAGDQQAATFGAGVLRARRGEEHLRDGRVPARQRRRRAGARPATACCRRCCGSSARAGRPPTRWKARCSSPAPPSSGCATGCARSRRPPRSRR